MHQQQQRGFSLMWTAVLVTLFALAAMAALFSMRYERNLFAEGWQKVAGAPAAQKVIDAAKEAVSSAPPTGPLRKCVIKGKTVVSNTECLDANPTSKDIDIVITRGVEAPKAPPKEASAPTSDPMTDKIIEKQLR